MAHQEQVLSVFVASPGDVLDERNKLEEIIREINVTWSHDLGVRLDLIRWETHAYPGIGQDAQDVINRQIPDDYDIFIGLMWCRFGTPTGRAGSGTVEEFNRAKSRYDQDASSVKFMMYFKDESVPPSRLDPVQLKKVRKFQKSLGAEGVLYWPFSGIDNFEKLIRIHLSKQIQDWKNAVDNSKASLLVIDSINQRKDGLVDASIEQNLSIFDLVEILKKKILNSGKSIDRMTDAIDELTDDFEENTHRFAVFLNEEQIKKSEITINGISILIENGINHCNTRMENELIIFRFSMESSIEILIKFLEKYVFPEQNWKESDYAKNIQKTIERLRISLGKMLTSSDRIRESIHKIPVMGNENIVTAKRMMISTIDKLIIEINSKRSLLIEAESAFWK